MEEKQLEEKQLGKKQEEQEELKKAKGAGEPAVGAPEPGKTTDGKTIQGKTIRVSAAVILRGGLVYATQRGYGDYKDWWEFPGGKIEPGEAPEDALAREIREELDIQVDVGEKLTVVEYDYPKFHLVMHCFVCRIREGEPVLKEHEAARWLTEGEITQVRWLPADVIAVMALTERGFQEAATADD